MYVLLVRGAMYVLVDVAIGLMAGLAKAWRVMEKNISFFLQGDHIEAVKKLLIKKDRSLMIGFALQYIDSPAYLVYMWDVLSSESL